MTLSLFTTSADPRDRTGHPTPTRQQRRLVRERRSADRRERIAEARRLAAQDRTSARLAELHHLQLVLLDARELVLNGWVQHGWFAFADETAEPPSTTVGPLPPVAARPVVGACLVGAVVQAGGGVPAAASQPVQRALDLTWQTLYGVSFGPSHWCPAPTVRAAHVRQLTRWNDSPDRTREDVAALLTGTASVVAAEADRLRVSVGSERQR
jgi:hypothetical protein